MRPFITFPFLRQSGKLDSIQNQYATVSSFDLEERDAEPSAVDPDHLQCRRFAVPAWRAHGDLSRLFLRSAYTRAGARVITRNRISLANSMPMAYREKIARIPWSS
jgi:hypothetical protein